MFKGFLCILLLGHVLGDFYAQTQNMAEKKGKQFRWVCVHGICYWVVQLLLITPIWSWEFAGAITVGAITHFVIDAFKYIYVVSLDKKNERDVVAERNIFFTDQILHILCLIGIAVGMAAGQMEIREGELCRTFFAITGLSEHFVLSWGMALVLIHKPANIAIQKLLAVYKPVVTDQDKNVNAGRFIGTIERIIMLFFIGIEQYSAIGLVLTAKSIARYDKIAKEKDFAEYYLLGTLLSTLIVIACAGII